MLKTERLILRRFTNLDLDSLHKHRSDKDVMKYLGGVQKIEQVAQRLRAYAEFYDNNGYAMCALIWRKTEEFIGVGGLQASSRVAGETEVGYTIDKKFWGKGIATECTRACLDFGFNKIGLKKVIALTHQANTGSIRVLEKAGMKFEIKTENMGDIWVQYAIEQEEYARDKKTSAPKIHI
jgi:RimJ/RimL family protein N-acetyltransferase